MFRNFLALDLSKLKSEKHSSFLDCNTESLKCLVCTGDRVGHNILDNNDGKGITILIGDQHAPAILTNCSDTCVVVVSYSNTTLTEFHDFFMLPVVKEQGRHNSKECSRRP